VVSFIGNNPRSESVNRWFACLLVVVGAGILVACLPGSEDALPSANVPVATPLPQLKPASVESIKINQIVSFPVEINVIARGHLPNACAAIDQVRQQRSGSDFNITIESLHLGDERCGDSRVPFEETIMLDVIGLPAGIYVVDLNGLKGTFKLMRENVADPENAVLSGLLWHDVCLADPDEVDPATTFEAGCIDGGDDLLSANGLLDDSEVGFGGVIVNLGAGDCPSTGLATTITDGNGVYLFGGLKAGSYCISVASEGTQNSSILISGEWTSPPSSSMAEVTAELEPGESKLNINFGWQYLQSQFPTLLPREEPCTDKALFNTDVTIPDGTVIAGGESFTKTWQLRNIGSCSWDEEYSLVFIEGDSLDGLELVPLSLEVNPGDDVQLSVLLSAPGEPGTYQGAWKLRNTNGILFGIGPGSDRAFWVQIVVDE
jgi:hypothetical protein